MTERKIRIFEGVAGSFDRPIRSGRSSEKIKIPEMGDPPIVKERAPHETPNIKRLGSVLPPRAALSRPPEILFGVNGEPVLIVSHMLNGLSGRRVRITVEDVTDEKPTSESRIQTDPGLELY